MTKRICRLIAASLACLTLLFCLTACGESKLDRAVLSELGASSEIEASLKLNVATRFLLKNYAADCIEASINGDQDTLKELQSDAKSRLNGKYSVNVNSTDSVRLLYGYGADRQAAIADIVNHDANCATAGAEKTKCGMAEGSVKAGSTEYYVIIVLFTK